MVDLTPTSPLDDLLPLSAGGINLSDAHPEAITSIMPYADKTDTCSEALQKAHEVALPAPGRSSGKAGNRVIWTGRGQYFHLGDKPTAKAVGRSASLSDQTDGWVVMALEGEGAEAVMARLTPLDLRASQFKRGHTARSEMAHMMSVITRTPKGFEIMVMRSFAHTAVHRIEEAMMSVAAQAGLKAG